MNLANEMPEIFPLEIMDMLGEVTPVTQITSESPVLVIASIKEVDSLSAYLSYEELSRLDRYSHKRDRQLSVISHGLKRLCLSRMLDMDPYELRFGKTVNGQPFLKESGKLNFSISHSGQWGVLAVNPKGRVGVDVEAGGNLLSDVSANSRLQRSRIARQILTHAELRRFIKNNFPQQLLGYWTQKEAVSKALGLGIGMDLVSIRCQGKMGNSMASSPEGEFNLVSFNLTNQCVLSVALDRAEGLKILRYNDGTWFRIITAIGSERRPAGRLRASLRQEQSTDELPPADRKRTISDLHDEETREQSKRDRAISG